MLTAAFHATPFKLNPEERCTGAQSESFQLCDSNEVDRKCVCVDIAASSSNEYFRIRAMTMWGFDHFFSVLRESGERMTAEQLDELKLGRDAMLYGYKNCRS